MNTTSIGKLRKRERPTILLSFEKATRTLQGCRRAPLPLDAVLSRRLRALPSKSVAALYTYHGAPTRVAARTIRGAPSLAALYFDIGGHIGAPMVPNHRSASSLEFFIVLRFQKQNIFSWRLFRGHKHLP